MVNFKDKYKKLHGRDVETVVQMAERYANVLDEENVKIAADIRSRQDKFDKEIKKVLNKDFMIVYGMRNNNHRLIRKYTSSKVLNNLGISAVSEKISFERPEDVFFMKMDKKAYDHFNLDDELRMLPNVPSLILEEAAVKNNRADDPCITYILGPDADKIAKLFGSDADVDVFENYKTKSKDPDAPKLPRGTAIELPLFEKDESSDKITYAQAVAEKRILIIKRGFENYKRSCDDSTSIWCKEQISYKFEKLYNFTNEPIFNSKFCYIKMGDYKRLQKFIKDTSELPTWDEVLRKVFTTKPEYITKMLNLAAKRSVKNATSIFNSYTSSIYSTALKVAKEHFGGHITEKQQGFIDDLKTVLDIKNASCNYTAGDIAKSINTWLGLKVPDTRTSSNLEVDLQLDTKYPWVNILYPYDCDNFEQMVQIFKIVESYK